MNRPTRSARATMSLLAMTLFASLFFVGASPASAASAPTVDFWLIDELPTNLAVGETAVIGVHVEASEPFVMAIALSDAYYPGRGVLFDGSSAVAGQTSADLFLTLTARQSTADLAAVQNWPTSESWPAGVAPVAIRVGARFAGGLVVGATFPFAVTVT